MASILLLWLEIVWLEQKTLALARACGLVGETGFEPATKPARCCLWVKKRPPRPERGALPGCATPRTPG
jgi:hypothetical protein